MQVDSDQAKFIDNLREAAGVYGAVADLLYAIRDGLLIDDLGNKEIVADEVDLGVLRIAQIAAAFAEADREE